MSAIRVAVFVLVGLFFFWFIVVPLFERFAPTRVVRSYQRRSRPLFVWSSGVVPGFALIETIGRRSGLPRLTPVGGRRKRDVFWFVAGAGRKALYVRNIEANPRVRVRVHGRWWTGTADLRDDDNPYLRMIGLNPVNGFFLLLAGGDHLAIRVDLDPRT
jgi:deazaflavin-dependent oxidoreductase (nitroreductase family)